MDEDTLDKWGESPLRELAHTVKNLFRGRITDITDPSMKVADGMTAAVSFLHRRGQSPSSVSLPSSVAHKLSKVFRVCSTSVLRATPQVSRYPFVPSYASK